MNENDGWVEGIVNVLENFSLENLINIVFARALLTKDLKEKTILLEHCAIMLGIHDDVVKEITNSIGLKPPSDVRGEFEYYNEKCKILLKAVWKEIVERLPVNFSCEW